MLEAATKSAEERAFKRPGSTEKGRARPASGNKSGAFMIGGSASRNGEGKAVLIRPKFGSQAQGQIPKRVPSPARAG